MWPCNSCGGECALLSRCQSLVIIGDDGNTADIIWFSPMMCLRSKTPYCGSSGSSCGWYWSNGSNHSILTTLIPPTPLTVIVANTFSGMAASTSDFPPLSLNQCLWHYSHRVSRTKVSVDLIPIPQRVKMKPLSCGSCTSFKSRVWDSGLFTSLVWGAILIINNMTETHDVPQFLTLTQPHLPLPTITRSRIRCVQEAATMERSALIGSKVLGGCPTLWWSWFIDWLTLSPVTLLLTTGTGLVVKKSL